MLGGEVHWCGPVGRKTKSRTFRTLLRRPGRGRSIDPATTGYARSPSIGALRPFTSWTRLPRLGGRGGPAGLGGPRPRFDETHPWPAASSSLYERQFTIIKARESGADLGCQDSAQASGTQHRHPAMPSAAGPSGSRCPQVPAKGRSRAFPAWGPPGAPATTILRGRRLNEICVTGSLTVSTSHRYTRVIVSIFETRQS